LTSSFPLLYYIIGDYFFTDIQNKNNHGQLFDNTFPRSNSTAGFLKTGNLIKQTNINMLNYSRIKNMHTFPISIPTQRSLYPKPLHRHNWKFQLFPITNNSLKINDYFNFFIQKSSNFPSRFLRSLYFIGSSLIKIGKKYHFPGNFPVICGKYYAICGTFQTILCYFGKSWKLPQTHIQFVFIPENTLLL
jgi:hypothetical protein